MKREEAILELKTGYPKDDTPTEECVRYEEAVSMAIEALRETERNPTITSWHDFDRGYNIAKEKFSRPHGEWLEVYLTPEEKCFFGELWECSVCKVKDKKSNFCPNCGADMSANDRQVTGKLDENTQKHYGFRKKY